jgi:transposase
MDEVVEFCADLDVHRDTVVATVRFPQGRQRGSETKTFGTDTAELVALGDWLISHQVTRVGLESTGVYWNRCSICWRTGSNSCGCSTPSI